MKRSFLPTILLVCALIGAFTTGYILRDVQEPEDSLRERSDLGHMTLTSAPRRVEIVRPLGPGEEDEAGDARFGGGTPSRPGGAWASSTSRRPSQDDASRFDATAVQSMLTMPQMRTAAFQTFYVPVRGGRPPLSGSEKEREKEKEEVPIERATSYAVFAPASGDNEAFSALRELLIGENEKEVTVEKVNTVSDGIASEAEVLVLFRGRGSIPQISKEMIEPFKQRKILGIGVAAAGLFGQAGLKIGKSNIAFGEAATPLVAAAENSVADLGEMPTSVFDPPLELNDPFFRHSLFAYYLGPQKPSNREGVEVIAHWQGHENYAPIVRQGSAVLIGVNRGIAKWSPEFRDLVRKVAAGLARR